MTDTQWAIFATIRTGPYFFVGSEMTSALRMKKKGWLKPARVGKTLTFGTHHAPVKARKKMFEVTAKGFKAYESYCKAHLNYSPKK